VLGVATLLVSGCVARTSQARVSDADSASLTGWRTDSEPGIMSVRYPPSWHARHFTDQGSFLTGVVEFGNQIFRSPCRGDPHVAVSCQGLPHARLRPGGLVLMWSVLAFPPYSPWQLLARAPGRPTIIDGRPAKIAVTPASAVCRSEGGTTSVRATVARRGGSAEGVLSVAGCVDNSDTAAAQILASIRSLKRISPK
jgi:hypothetical protein